MMAGTDAELFGRWREGDRVAGSQLFERHFPAILRFFYAKAPTEAEDLVQTTFRKALEGAERFEQRSTFRAYLFGVARFTLLEYFRRRRPVFDPSAISMADLGTTPSQRVAKKERHSLVLQALESIPVDSRVALELYYWEDMSVKEVAEVLQVPVGTVKTRLSTSRRRVAEALACQVDDVGAELTQVR